MKILALITARGGSKRLPKKNVKNLGGLPLIAWSINLAREIDTIIDVLVSTDDIEISEVSKKYGALVPWLRPEELATDTASSIDVCLHALDWYENIHGPVDGLLLLQPTSPFRSLKKVKEGISLFLKNKSSVVGVALADTHPHLCFELKGNKLKAFIKNENFHIRSQDLPEAYKVNGAFYLISPSELRSKKKFLNADTTPLVFDDPKESIDIDTEWDWSIAEKILEAE